MVTRTRWAGLLGLAVAALGAPVGAEPVQTGVERVPVYVNQDRLDQDALMLNQFGRTVLPMRALFESLGARVEWDPRERAVYAWKEDSSGVRFGIGERQAQILQMSGDPGPGNWGRRVGTRNLDAPAMMYGSRIYVPIRAAGETLNAQVQWDPAAPAVNIETGTQVAAERRGRSRVLGTREERTRVDRPGEEDRDRLERERLAREERARVRQEEQDRLAREERERRREERRADAAEILRALDVSLIVRDDRLRGPAEVPIQLVVINRSGRAVTVPFRTSQQFEIEVLQNGQVIWNWASDRTFAQAVTSLTLKPGEKQTFSTRWDMTTNSGRPVERGTYTVRGRLTPAFSQSELMDEKMIDVLQ